MILYIICYIICDIIYNILYIICYIYIGEESVEAGHCASIDALEFSLQVIYIFIYYFFIDIYFIFRAKGRNGYGKYI